MMNALNAKNINQFELQQKQIMLMGGNVKQQKNLSQPEIEKLKKDFIGMYFALAAINWGHGMNLGRAWQTALEQMGAFVSAKAKITNHPVCNHLNKIYSDFRRDMSRHIMTSEYANAKLNPEFANSFINYGTRRIQETKNSINNLYQKYMPQKQIQNPFIGHKFEIAKQNTQKIMQQMLLQQFANQRTA